MRLLRVVTEEEEEEDDLHLHLPPPTSNHAPFITNPIQSPLRLCDDARCLSK